MKIIKIRTINKKLRGFSLLETITAIFIFSIVIVLTVAIFAGAFKSREKSKEIQQAIEDTRFALEIMAKNIRMSTIDQQSSSTIYVYNYSQGKCIKYAFSGNNLTAGEVSLASRLDGSGNITKCEVQSYTDQNNMIKTGSLTAGRFFATISTPTTVGKVTILVKVAGSPNALETSVSLRDYIK